MKILTWPTPNFGDRLNDWIWEQYIPELLDDNADDLLVGIGSLLNHRLPKGPKKNIFGSGVGHGDLPTVDQTWKIHWLRGPRSASIIQAHPKLVITDGGVLIGDLVTPSTTKEYDTSFMCHCSACHPGSQELLLETCKQAGIHFINPNSPMERVISDINKSRRLLTEALHGAVTADALRVPWAPLSRQGVFAFKWHDWMESMQLRYGPSRLAYRPRWFFPEPARRVSRRLVFPLLRPTARALLFRQLVRLKESARWILSDDGVLADRIKKMTSTLKRL